MVREGNPGKRPAHELEGGVRLRPEAPGEPDWTDWWPAAKGDRDQHAYVARLRATAREEWRRVVPVLDAQGLLAAVDLSVLFDHCAAVALHRECVRDLALNGMKQMGERGWQKNGSTTILAQQRDVLKHTRGQLGLTPVARDALNAPGVDVEDDPFD